MKKNKKSGKLNPSYMKSLKKSDKNLKHGPIFEVFGFFLIWLNFHISLFLPKSNIHFVENTHPFGFDVSGLATLLVTIITIVALYKGKIFDKYPLSSVLIVSGVFSNFIERIYFGNVKDFLDIGIAYINLADLEIWIGLLFLNIQVWFFDKGEKQTEKETKKEEV